MRSQAAFWPFAFAGSLALHAALTLTVADLAHGIQGAPPPAELIIGDDTPFPAEMLAPSSAEPATDAATVEPAQPEPVASANQQLAAVNSETLAPSTAQEQTAAAPAEERIAAASSTQNAAPNEMAARPETPKPAEAELEPESPAAQANSPVADAAPLKPLEETPSASPPTESGERLAPSPGQAQAPAALPDAAASALPLQDSAAAPAAPPEPTEMAALPPEAIQAAPEALQAPLPVTGNSAAAKASEATNLQTQPSPASLQAPAAASQPNSVQPAEAGSAPPASSPAAAAISQTAPVAAAKPAASSTAQPAPAEPAPQTQIAALPPAALTETRPERMRRFLRNYESGSGCFFAVPTALDSPRPRIDGFGSRSKPIVDFGEAFERALGVAPAISVRTITEYQCPAITFIGGLLKSRFPELTVKLEQDQILSGTELRGSLEGVRLRWLYLVLIDDDGMVQDLSQFLRNSDGRLTFATPMYVQGQGHLRNQLLVGVATSQELSLLKTDQKIKAEDFFPAVVDEADRKGADVALGVGAFRVE